ncbi:MAG: M48 family metalloprotease [Candidatus Pacebacteria bacterium]|nr:M48 family metalloprotease [Candidatus Paceibacterota bacterium]
MLKNNFQFDEQVFERFLAERGFSHLPEIEFCDQLAFINGFYQPSKNQIKIFLKPITFKKLILLFRPKEFFAKVLAHELGHCFDKKMNANFAKRYWVEILSTALFCVVILIGFLKILNISSWPILFAILPFLYIAYKLNPAEIRARKFSRDHWREVYNFCY